MPARRGGKKTAYRYADVGLQFAATIGVFTYAGYWADSNWGTRPWLLILGVFSGFGLGMVSMLAKMAKLSRSPTNRTSQASASEDHAKQPAARAQVPPPQLPPDQ